MEMNDNQFLYISTILCLILILLSFKFSKQAGFLNLVIFSFYTILLYYNLLYKGDGGSSLLWWFYLIILTLLQSLILGIYISIRYFKK